MFRVLFYQNNRHVRSVILLNIVIHSTFHITLAHSIKKMYYSIKQSLCSEKSLPNNFHVQSVILTNNRPVQGIILPNNNHFQSIILLNNHDSQRIILLNNRHVESIILPNNHNVQRIFLPDNRHVKNVIL